MNLNLDIEPNDDDDDDDSRIFSSNPKSLTELRQTSHTSCLKCRH